MYRYVKPIDSTVPAAGAVTNPAILTVNVIDPAVINVDWTVDGTVHDERRDDVRHVALAAGSHTISAKAYDNADDTLVRTTTARARSPASTALEELGQLGADGQLDRDQELKTKA